MPVSAGTRLGPYEVVELLGAGGMGEVYRARDSRLGRDVALKVLHDDVARDPARLKRFELEARAVASLNHPHILTVHDVGSDDGTPYVVSELLEGESLREVLSRRSPAQRQVLAWAVQAAQGLAAAHRKGIVHRDLKPENLFLTTDGRIKILDFGLAKQTAANLGSAELTESSPTKPGVVMGTVAYMSPEQVQAQAVDARSDLFSFGVVLYELLGRKHPFRRETVAATVGAILQETPAPLVSLDATIPRAVDGIVRRCLEKRREERFQGAHDLGLALEAVLAAPAGSVVLEDVEERSPYPGLASFTEKDGAVFFGRETEVKAFWERIRSRKLLAVIGPSGVGKTSFLRAGILASRPQGWVVAHATPGANPALGLARALTPELAGDAEAMADLLSGVSELTQAGEPERVVSAVKRWRSRHAEALLVLDQFEELFTLNPPETQARVASLLQRVVSEADVHVALSMRDDFLIRCSDHEPLAPVFESLTPLNALTRDGLRRAVVEPAKKRGYRFEDQALVDEMVSTVEGVRGALPLLAFAVARLWDGRDRERKVLTREAYREIAGVEGALAQHAEATMDRIGPARQGLVREIFRNLVTAQGTRAVIDREELLSAFPDRPAAEEALRELVDARLLTTYEVEGRKDEPCHHRVDVVHESLLKAWPRLVRWQAQDEDGALLRDQLKQAAHLWDEKGRKADLLWTGTAYTEYELWRSRYPGALTALEQDFARSMRDRERRTRRQRRAIVTATLVGLSVIAAVVSWSRHQAVREAERALRQARLAQASRLVALGRSLLDTRPTGALAFARKSLETADGSEARQLAIEALWRAPAARIAPLPVPSWRSAWSPDGRWLAVYSFSGEVLLFPEEGGPPRVIGGFSTPNSAPEIAFGADGTTLLTHAPQDATIRVVSIPDGRELKRLPYPAKPGGVPGWPGSTQPTGLQQDVLEGADPRLPPVALLGEAVVLRSDEGTAREVGRLFDREAAWVRVAVAPGRDWLALGEPSGRLTLWPLGALPRRPPRHLEVLRPDPWFPLAFDAAGKRLTWGSASEDAVSVWDLEGPPEANPRSLRRAAGVCPGRQARFHPRGDWLATANHDSLTFWALNQPWPRVLRGHGGVVVRLVFTPDAGWLLSCAAFGDVRRWPLEAVRGAARVVPALGSSTCAFMQLSPTGSAILRSHVDAEIHDLEGPGGRILFRSKGEEYVSAAFDPSGMRVAIATWFSLPGSGKRLRLVDVSSEKELTSLSLVPDGETEGAYDWGVGQATFLADGQMLGAGPGGLRLFDLTSGRIEWLWRTDRKTGVVFAVSADGTRLVAAGTPGDQGIGPWESPHRVDVATGTRTALPAYGSHVHSLALDPSGAVLATGDDVGVVRVGWSDGDQPHLLLGHGGPVTALAISSDRRWIASASSGEIRLWPMPDLSKPPLHALPHAELLAKLRELTNLQVLEDSSSPGGYTLEVGPFPGWKDVPTW